MGDYSIISPLVVTSDERGQNFALGLGDTPISPFLAGVQGLQQGATFGANITAKVLETQRLNDPDTLAADKLRAELQNQNAAHAVTINAANIKDHETYGARRAEAGIALQEAQAYHHRNPGVSVDDRLKELELRGKITERDENIEEKRRQRAIEDYDNAPSGSGLPRPTAENDYNRDRNAPVPVPRQSQESTIAPPPTKEGTSALLDDYQQQREQAITSSVHKSAQDVIDLSNSLLETSQNPDGSTDYSVPVSEYKNINSDAAFATLSDIKQKGKVVKDPFVRGQLAKMAQAVLSRTSPSDNERYVAAAPKSQRKYLTDLVNHSAALVAEQGDASHLSDDQKPIHAAGLPFSALIAPEETYNKILSKISQGNASVDDPELMIALFGNRHINALTEASKGGTQAVTIKEIESPTPSPTATPVSDTANTGPAPASVLEYKGTDGTFRLAPTPTVDPSNPDPSELKHAGQAHLAAKVSKKINDTVGITKQTEQNVTGAQDAVAGGGMMAAAQPPAPSATPSPTATATPSPTATANPTATPQLPTTDVATNTTDITPAKEPDIDASFDSPNIGKKLGPLSTRIKDVAIAEYEATEGPKATNKFIEDGKLAKAAENYGEKKQLAFEKRNKGINEELAEASKDQQTIGTIVSEMESVATRAEKDGFTNLLGPQGKPARIALEAKVAGKAWWDIASGLKSRIGMESDSSITPLEQQQLAFLSRIKQVQSNQLLATMKDKTSAFNTAAEQLVGMQANFNENTPYDELLNMVERAKSITKVKDNALEFRTELLARAGDITPAQQRVLTTQYINGGHADPASDSYVSPKDYLYGAKFTPRAKATPTPSPTGTPTPTPTPAPAVADIATPSDQGDVVGANQKTSSDPLNQTTAQQMLGPVGDFLLNPEEAQNFRRGLDKPGQKAFDLVKSLDPRAQAAIQKQALLHKRGLEDPETRKEIDAVKAELQATTTPGGKAMRMLADNMFPKSFKDYVGTNVRAGYDEVANTLVGAFAGSEVADKYQHDRHVRWQARDEATQDTALDNPFPNTAAAMTAFGIWKSTIDGVGGTALRTLAKSNNPTIVAAVEGLKKVAQAPLPSWLGKTVGNVAGTTAAEAGAFAIPHAGEGKDLEHLAEGGLASLFFHRFVGPLVLNPLAQVGKNVIRKGFGVAEQTPAQTLGGAMNRSGIAADQIENTVARTAPGESALGNLDDGAYKVVQSQTATAQGQLALNTADASGTSVNQRRLAAENARRGEIAETAGVSDTQLPAQKTITENYDKNVTGKVAAEEAFQTAEVEIATENTVKQAVDEQMATIRGIGNQGVAVTREKAEIAIHDLSKIVHSENPVAELTTGKQSGGSAGNHLQNQIDTLGQVEKVLEADAPNTAYANMRRIYQTPFKGADVKTLESSLHKRQYAFNEAVRATNEYLESDVSSNTFQPTFEFLSQMYKQLAPGANKRIRANPEILEGMRAQIRDFLDSKMAVEGRTSATPFTDLNTSYGATQDVARGVGAYKKLLTDVEKELRLEAPKQSKNFEKSFLNDNLEKELGRPLHDEVRVQLRAVDETRAQIDGAIKDRANFKPTFAEDLQKASSLVGTEKVFGETLLNEKNVRAVTQVAGAVKDPQLMRDGMTRAAVTVNNTGKKLSAKQWENLGAVLSEEEVATLKHWEQQSFSIERASKAISTSADNELKSAVDVAGKSQTPGRQAETRIYQKILDLFKGNDYQALTKREQRELAKALGSADTETLRELLLGTAESMRNPKKIDVSGLLSAIALGGQNTPDTSEAQARRDEAAKNSPEAVARRKRLKEIQDMD